MPRVAVVFHSGYGHTQVQAEAVARGAAKGGAKVSLIPVAEAADRIAELNAADAIVFGTPTYMGSASAAMKSFMEATSKLWMERTWKDKIAAGFVNSASQNGDKQGVFQQLITFALQHGMIWVGLDLLPGNNSSTGSVEDLNRLGVAAGAAAQSNADEGPDKGPLASDLKTAEHLGRRVTETVKKFTLVAA
ncbi:MAG TPA: flavodoxin family protein [Alphaproteobacteria bacterium]|jgi:NAD(P)H dehydrogenase (quinone)|nr:flavodoxin family protein [Alphaproteobacteria bacterium]